MDESMSSLADTFSSKEKRKLTKEEISLERSRVFEKQKEQLSLLPIKIDKEEMMEV
jgi:hypothetical protein